MKKFFKFFTATAIIAVGLMGCSEETPVASDPTPTPTPTPAQEAGVPTYATFFFKVQDEGASTKAKTTDENESTAVTTSFHDVRLLVFDYQADSTGICEANELVTGGSVDKSATVLVRSGNKILLVIANAASKDPLNKILKSTAESGGSIVVSTDPLNPNLGATTFKQFMDNYNHVDVGVTSITPPAIPSAAVTEVVFSNLVKTGTGQEEAVNSMVYSNGTDYSSAVRFLAASVKEEDSKTGVGNVPSVNRFEINLQRTVAKAVAYYKHGSLTTGQAITTGDGKGELTQLRYNLQNVNRGVNLFQRKTITTPNKPVAPYFLHWNSTTSAQAEADSGLIFKPFYYTTYAPANIDQTLEYAASFTKQPATGPSIYVTENATSRTFNGAKTYFAIKGQYKPVTGTPFITDMTDFNKAATRFTLNTTTNYSDGTTFWRLHNKYYGAESGALSVSGGTPSGGSITGGTTLIIPNDVLFTNEEAILKVLYVINTGDTIGYGAANKPALLLANAENVQKFNNALTYYRLNIRQGANLADNNEYVLRNSWYQAAITDFTGLGSPSLEDLDDGSGDEDTSPTYVTAVFTVLPWEDVPTDTPVGPWEP